MSVAAGGTTKNARVTVLKSATADNTTLVAAIPSLSGMDWSPPRDGAERSAIPANLAAPSMRRISCGVLISKGTSRPGTASIAIP